MRIVPHPVGQPDPLEPAAGDGAGVRRPRDLQRRGDVLLGGHVRQQVEGLEDQRDAAAAQARAPVLVEQAEVLAEQPDPSARRPLQAGGDGDQRGLAGTRRPRQGEALARGDPQVEAAQDLDGAGGGRQRERDVLQNERVGGIRQGTALRWRSCGLHLDRMRP
jgi:hypothetical protein